MAFGTRAAATRLRYQTGAEKLLGRELSGFAFDFTGPGPQGYVRDAATPTRNGRVEAHNFWNTEFWIPYLLPRGNSGLLDWGPHNYLARSSDFSDAEWTKVNVTATAGVLTETTGNGLHHAWQQDLNNSWSTPVGETFTMSIEVKPNGRDYCYLNFNDGTDRYSHFLLTGAGSVFSQAAGSTSTIEAVDDGWYRLTVTRIIATSFTLTFYVGLTNDGSTTSYVGDTAVSLGVRNASQERGPTRKEHISTTDVDFHRFKLECELGVGYKHQWTLINSMAYSNDFTQTNWTKSNMTTAKTATGPDGIANSASTLTATAGNATALQSVTSASRERLVTCYIKRRTGTGTVELTMNNGTNWTAVTVTSEWARVYVASGSALTNPTAGIRIVTSGDAVDVAYFQMDAFNHVPGWTPTPSFSSQSILMQGLFPNKLISDIPWNTAEGTIYVEFTDYDAYALADVTGWGCAIDTRTSNSPDIIDLYRQNTALTEMHMSVVTDTASQMDSNIGVVTSDVPQTACFTWKNNLFAGCMNKGTPVRDTSGTIEPAMTYMWMMASWWWTQPLKASVKRLLFVPRQIEEDGDLVNSWR